MRNRKMKDKIFRTYKRKLILNHLQKNRLLSWLGACRVVYNLGLEIKSYVYTSSRRSVSKYDLMKQVTDLRKDIEWINDVPAGVLTHIIFRLDRAYGNFLKNHKAGAGYPKFANKKSFKSIHLPVTNVSDRMVWVPKIGWIKMFKDEPIGGVVKTAQIVLEPTGFFICIQCEDAPLRFESENQAIGLDMGISHFCVDSNGIFIENPKHFNKYERRLRIENRSLARKKKGSVRWKNQVKRLSMLHHKIGNVRRDFLHKGSTMIAKNNAVVYMEDLNIRGMVKNKNLSKQILDAGWGLFRGMLQYKTNVVLVNPKYT